MSMSMLHFRNANFAVAPLNALNSGEMHPGCHGYKCVEEDIQCGSYFFESLFDHFYKPDKRLICMHVIL